MTVTTELQRLLDALGKRLERNVTVDDARLRQLAFSSHEYPGMDQLREESILTRDVPPEVASWTFDAGARTATGPFRPPVNPDIGATVQRLCVPVRQQGTLLGFIWILEGDNRLADSELQTVLDAVETIAIVMQRDQLAGELHRSRARELLRDLVVAHDPDARSHAAAELVDHDLFVAGEPAFVVFVSLHADERPLLEAERNTLAGRLERITGRLSDRRHISLVRRDHGMLLLSDKDPLLSGKAKHVLLEELLANLDRDLPKAEPIAGCGAVVDDLADVHISYRQAERTARVARHVRGLDRVTSYDRLGVYGLLARIPPDELTPDALPPGLRRLFETGTKGEQLAVTLEAFLDNAGDVQLTAEQMFVHRTTLYYRLQRIEELTGVRLSNGEDRLAYHLGLKIARLIGLWDDRT
jgi:sugar diacid utilization regulator